MHCSTCGTAITKGASYCSRCGTMLPAQNKAVEAAKLADKLVEVTQYLSAATAVVGVGGLFFVFLLVRELLRFGVVNSGGLALVILSLGTVFGISALLIRQLSRVVAAYLETRGRDRHTISHMNPPGTAPLQIKEPGGASVTEHTTYALEHAYKERGPQ